MKGTRIGWRVGGGEKSNMVREVLGFASIVFSSGDHAMSGNRGRRRWRREMSKVGEDRFCWSWCNWGRVIGWR